MKNILILSVIILALFVSCKSSAHFSGNNCEKEFDSVLHYSVYTQVDLMPTFKGGREEMLDYLIKHLKMTNEEDFQGKINLIFVVDSTGSVIGARIKNKNFKDLSKIERSAISIAEQMPKWNVGKCSDRPVAVKISLPIYF